MSQQSAKMMIVRTEKLGEYPSAFQKYVAKYFKEQKIGGISHHIAFLAPAISSQHHKSLGVAFCHSSDINFFGDRNGMESGIKLSDWIKQKIKDDTQDVIEIDASWDDCLLSVYD
ncbi:MAG: hypothetical protein WC791_00285 [Candidatus Paceibacterota bacterium]|jgi:hypothetical protein